MRTSRKNIPAYTTKDGSEIRELMHPLHHSCHKQSLAEATVKPGCQTRLHQHQEAEELYFIESRLNQLRKLLYGPVKGVVLQPIGRNCTDPVDHLFRMDRIW